MWHIHQEGGLHSLLALLVWPFLVVSRLWEELRILLPLRLSLGDQVRERGALSDPQLSSSLQPVKKWRWLGIYSSVAQYRSISLISQKLCDRGLARDINSFLFAPWCQWCWHFGPCSGRSSVQFSSVQSLSRVWLFATPWIAARQASLSITNSQC